METKMSKQQKAAATKTSATKTASITLRKGSEVLSLLAMLRPDGKVEVTVTTRDKETKAVSRGMTAMFPTMAAARGMLGDRFEEPREKMIAIWRDANAADDGSLRLPQEYLLSIVRL